jgi:alpha-beta hydrolase superfamily lysophospholipase
MLAWDGPPGAPAVIVLHGLETSTDGLREAVAGLDPYARLAEEGVHVLALDWPGHGRSGGRRGALSYRLAMEAVSSAVDVARERWDAPVGVLGTGFGGVLGFYAALEDERVGAVVCNGVLDLRDVRPVLQRLRQQTLLPVAGWLRRRLPARQQSAIPLPALAVVANTDLAEAPSIAKAIRRHPQAVRTYDLQALGSILLAPEDKPDIAAGRCPTLIAVGSNDRALPPRPPGTSPLGCPAPSGCGCSPVADTSSSWSTRRPSCPWPPPSSASSSAPRRPDRSGYRSRSSTPCSVRNDCSPVTHGRRASSERVTHATAAASSPATAWSRSTSTQ